MTAELRHDRDRYVAFAFAAADLLVELDPAGRILAAVGAPQTVCGRERADITGGLLVDLVTEIDRPLVRRLLQRIDALGRIDAVALHLDHAAGKPTVVLLGGCRLPTIADRLFVTLTLVPIGAGNDERARDAGTGLLDRGALVTAATRSAMAGSRPRQLTLLRLEGLAGAAGELPAERAQVLMAEIGAAMRAESAGGDTAGRLGTEEFGLVAGTTAAAEGSGRLVREIDEAARAAGLPEGAFATRVATIDLAVGGLEERDAARAIAYAVSSFSAVAGKDFTLSSLRQGLGAAVADAAQRYGELRRSIADGAFDIVYQPIVALPDRLVHHYEALVRFAPGKSPLETITFGEAVGLSTELDIVMCRKVIAALAETPGARVAVNISGRSAESPEFRAALEELLAGRRDMRERLIFELTESAAVERIDEAALLLRWLKAEGYAICLDDFGAGAAAYSYLRHFTVDFVKIDGPFLKAAMTQSRERALVRSICRLCGDLGCGVVGEMIEDEPAMTAAIDLGVGFGQGWLFGRPLPVLRPASPPAAIPAVSAPPLRRARRKGMSEVWQ